MHDASTPPNAFLLINCVLFVCTGHNTNWPTTLVNAGVIGMALAWPRYVYTFLLSTRWQTVFFMQSIFILCASQCHAQRFSAALEFLQMQQHTRRSKILWAALMVAIAYEIHLFATRLHMLLWAVVVYQCACIYMYFYKHMHAHTHTKAPQRII
jgi:hypothetical protein